MNMQIIDLTFEIETGMPTCGTQWHQNVTIERIGTIEKVGRNTSRIILGSHSGTHMDAPLHFISDASDIAEVSLNNMIGEATVVDFRQIGQHSKVSVDDVMCLEISEKMIFCFGWYKKWKSADYYDGFPYFEEEAIRFLVKNGMKFIAMDTPSPDDSRFIGRTADDSPNHKFLLEKGAIIVEYLNNTDEIVGYHKVNIIALPLKIRFSDGSPCRAVVVV